MMKQFKGGKMAKMLGGMAAKGMGNMFKRWCNDALMRSGIFLLIRHTNKKPDRWSGFFMDFAFEFNQYLRCQLSFH
jgi:hypothetical protein